MRLAAAARIEGLGRSPPATLGKAASTKMTLAMMVLAALAAVVPTRAAPAAAPAAAGEPAPATIQLDRHRAGFRTLPVRVGGRTRTFLFDTGGGNTVVSPAVADDIGCEPRPGGFGLRMTGERVHYGVCRRVRLGLGPVDVVHGTILVVDVGALLPRGAPAVEGVVSLESFGGRAVTLELAAGRLVVETPASLAGRIGDMTALQARFEEGATASGVNVSVAVRAGGRLAWLSVDSGNLDRVLLDDEVARELGLELRSKGFGFESRFPGAGTPPRWEFDAVRLDVVGLGEVEVPVAVTELIFDGALDVGFLERWVLTFDLEGRRLFAAPAAGDPR